MPWYTRKSYFGSPSEPDDVTHSLVLEAANDAEAIKQATKTRFLPGTTRAELLDEKGGFICDLIVRRS